MTALQPTRRAARWVVRLTTVALVAAVAIIGYQAFWHYNFKRFAVVQPGRLIRSGQPTQWGLRYIVQRHGARTVLCLRQDDAPLATSVLDAGEPDGPLESQYARELGVKFVHWPMGGEAYWPWPKPQQFEDFFRLFDDPDNYPITLHCVAGKHRTGTLVALYRIEYDRWPAERALQEMKDFEFGPDIPLHDHNVRTYRPRPLPTAEQWTALQAAFEPLLGPGTDYSDLVRKLRAALERDEAEQRMRDYVEQGHPFALCLAQRVIDLVDPHVEQAITQAAHRTLHADDQPPEAWASAAAIVADYGEPSQQRDLLRLLQDEITPQPPSPRFRAVVAGVTDRYTPNRIAYLLPLLDDQRLRPEFVNHRDPFVRRYRYCDTAVARLSSILNLKLYDENYPIPKAWDRARSLARTRFCASRLFSPSRAIITSMR